MFCLNCKIYILSILDLPSRAPNLLFFHSLRSAIGNPERPHGKGIPRLQMLDLSERGNGVWRIEREEIVQTENRHLNPLASLHKKEEKLIS